MDARHELRTHTGELELFLEAPDLKSLFAEAGRALAELMTGEERLTPSQQEDRVTVRAADGEALLAEWLNELIYRSEREKKIFIGFEIEKIDGGALAARVRGAEASIVKTAVKAATLHRLKIEQAGDAVRATVVLDV